jgi:hypothetical protein
LANITIDTLLGSAPLVDEVKLGSEEQAGGIEQVAKANRMPR